MSNATPLWTFDRKLAAQVNSIHQPIRCCDLTRLGRSCLDDRLDNTVDVLGGAALVRLASVEPSDDGLQSDGGEESGGPPLPRTVRDPFGEVALGDLYRSRPDGVDHVAELWFARGMAEQQPKSVGVGRRGAHQTGNRLLVVVIGPHRVGDPYACPVEDRAVEVGLRVKVAVEDHVADTGFRADVVEAGGGEAGASERASGRVENLLAPFRAGQPP